MLNKVNETKNINEPSNDGAEQISFSEPYIVSVTLRGSSDLLFHRWSAESVDEKAKASKGSKAKKTDDVNSYVWRNEEGYLCIPGEYVRRSIIEAAKFRQDPRSPRKSAMDLYKAGVISLTNLSNLGTKAWDYEDRRRVVVQRNGINRTRPAFRVGWEASFEILVNLPEYISVEALRETLESAGRLIGIADFRPTFGRFGVVGFEIVDGK